MGCRDGNKCWHLQQRLWLSRLKSILVPSVIINPARPGQNLSVTLPKPPTITLHISGGGSNEFVSYVSVCVCVSVRGLINVESNAARDTHTP